MKNAAVLRLGRDLELPVDAVTQTFAVLGKRGSGKTNLGVVLVEEMIPAGLPVIIVDPVGVWWGLRAGTSTRERGLPVIILGGEHADVPLEPTSGSVIADFIVETGKPCVLDLSGMRKGEQTRFMTDFAERLYHRKAKLRDALHLVVDECDSFAPQRAMPDQARLLGAMEDLVRRGRSRGIGMTMITQRPAVLSKNVLTQAEVLVVFQLTAPQDRDAIGEWVRANADQTHRSVLDAALPALPQGEAFVWSPSWLKTFQRVHVRRRRTFDSSKTPEAGRRVEAPRELAAVDIEALKQRIAGTIERAKAEDPRSLKKRIGELEADLRTAQRVTRVEKVEVPVVGREELKRLEALATGLAKTIASLVEAVGRAGSSEGRPPTVARPPATPPRTPAVPVLRESKARPPQNGEAPSLRKGERRMLETLARHHPVRFTRAQLGTLSGFTPSGGTFRQYFGTLTRAGYVHEQGDLVGLTEAGLAEGGGAPAAPMTVDEVIEMWRGALRAGERAMLDVLVEVHPHEIALTDLGERTGFTASGGTFRQYLGTLRRNGLADVEDGQARAGEALFVAETSSRRRGRARAVAS